MARRGLASELNRRLVRMGMGAGSQGPEPMLRAYLSTLFRQQREVLECRDPLVAIFTSRRSGKSTLTPAKLFDAAEKNPGTVIFYVHPDGGKRAGETLFGPDINLEHIAEEYRLPYKVNLHEKKLTHRKSGTEIRLRGADDMREAKKFRGDKVSLVVLEEAQNFAPAVLSALIDSELGPALSDVGGQLVVQGTPGEVCHGPWYEITRNEDAESLAKRRRGWRVFEWSALDNPHMMRPELGYQAALTIATKVLPFTDKSPEQLVELLVRGGAQGRALVEATAAADPTVTREWFKRWVRDSAALFYAFNSSLNLYQPGQLPRGHVWYYVVGVDLGTGDAYAHHVWAFSPTCPDIYEVESFSEAGLDSEDWRNQVRQVIRRWNPVGCVVDEGGLGKGVAQGWRDKYALAVEPASKQHKAAAVATLNGELRAGRAKLLVEPYEDKQRGKVSAGATAAEMAALRKDPKSPPDKAAREDPSQPNHACFVAGTLVETEHGPLPVEQVRLGTRVWTRHGLRPAVKAAQSGVRPTWILESEGGHRLEGTGDHPIWTSGGWVPLERLTPRDTLVAWESTGCLSAESSRASSTGGTPSLRSVTSASTSPRPLGGDCTAMSGARSTGPSRGSTTSTTETGTHSTTTWRTWSASSGVSTCASIVLSLSTWLASSSTYQQLGRQLRRGIDLLLGGSGTASTDEQSWRSETPRSTPAPAWCAALASSLQWSQPRCAVPSATLGGGGSLGRTTSSAPAPSVARPSPATASGSPNPGVVPVRVRSVAPTGNVLPVYNLTVEEHHEYFAGGLLVSNCDAALYGFRKAWEYMGREDKEHSVAPEPGSPEAKELEKKQRMDRARARVAAEQREVDQVRGLLGEDASGEW